MDSDSIPAGVHSLDRIYLRLTAETFAEIDAACHARPGNVSRNTWIAEAVQEKLAREPVGSSSQTPGRRAHG